MESRLQLLALTDALLTNWPTIRMLMGEPIATVDNLLTEKAKELSIAKSLDEVEAIVHDLLTLTLDTPAHEYVRSVIARADLRDMALETSVNDSQLQADAQSRVKSAAELLSYPPEGEAGPGPDLTWVEHSAAAALRGVRFQRQNAKGVGSGKRTRTSNADGTF
jgi:hypothetical protein